MYSRGPQSFGEQNYNAYGGFNNYNTNSMGGLKNDFNQGQNSGGGSGAASAGGFFTSEAGSAKKDAIAQQTVRPVTIKQLLAIDTEHPDKPFVIDGNEIKFLYMIGVVRNINSQATMTTYSVEDGSGSIEVKVWANHLNNESDEAAGIQPNQYVRIIGEFKLFNDKRHVLALSILPINDFNEITYHLLSVVQTHLESTKGMGGGKAGHGVLGHDAKSSHVGGSGDSVVKRVYDYIASVRDKLQGVDIKDIERDLAPEISPNQIRAATNSLIDDGNIFTVIDESHFLSTNYDMPR
ncbi:Replication factor A protein 2 [Zancudomyces culisetae]|uniref:Replication factor A protein 2 n=1 Tax=Zancudomyces culisetae TaxID=1213189 RepID=A0A1R1PLD1_ZANCU|nr:Replication factor A protein 2 [Zancudomyces culisetae]|eukprot:OMH81781.1 Replication factor A protein 2 [Zancudomyces culisetae]